ncbi:MAG: HDIG domain-containing protein [Candidatus Tantalella remota]|nr:HDIG domain-containing protein [Candidatus Tantalella remota]
MQKSKISAFKKIAVKKETISILMVLVFFMTVLGVLFLGPALFQVNIHEGDVSLKNVYAPYDFTYFWGVDEESTQKAKETSVGAVPFWAQRDVSAEEKATSGIDDFFAALSQERAQEIPVSEQVKFLRESVDVEFSDRNLRSLVEYPDTEKLKEVSHNVLRNVFLLGYIHEDDLIYLKGKNTEKVAIADIEADIEVERRPEDLLDKGKVTRTVEEYVNDQVVGGDRRTRQALASVISGYVVPNVKLDDKKTEAYKKEALESVKSVARSWKVKKNELIVEKGMRVDGRNITQIAQLRSLFRQDTRPTFLLGVLLLFLLLSMVAVIYTTFSQKVDFLSETKNIAIVLINMLFMLIIADVVLNSPQPSYFIPMAGIGMLITLLVSFNTAFLIVVLMSVFLSLIFGGKIPDITLVLLVGSTVGMFAVKGARRRARILWAGLLAGVAKCLAIVCIGLVNGMQMDFFVKDGAWGIASGILSGFIVMGLLPVFEYLFKVPTNISLLELSDLNHPLLKKLAIEAPGTYHHSIMVGNLAEAACDSIGANSLLARVGAYYHDIGKIPKAEYFSENEMGVGSRHATLTPSMSALIIGKHVKDGVEMAKQYKLNNKIVDFITQHHGDSRISYFYQKALEKSENGTVIDEENFRYPGPKPQTKESAIILLADSVEASSRTLNEPTPASIRNLVKKIVNNKFIDAQLDGCDLTLRDMHDIADSFVRVLMGTFHTRLDYPEETDKNSEETPKNDDNGKQRKPKQKKKN